jgi:hypothetical protein
MHGRIRKVPQRMSLIPDPAGFSAKRTKAGELTSASGENAKYSREQMFSALLLELGHCSMQSACRKRAIFKTLALQKIVES